MRDHRERLLKLPYSMGCATESCVALGKKNQPKKQKHHAKHVLFPSRLPSMSNSPHFSLSHSVCVCLFVCFFFFSGSLNFFFPFEEKMEEKERQPIANMRKIRSFLVLPNSGLATGVNKVIQSCKSFPKLFGKFSNFNNFVIFGNFSMS